MNRQDYETIRDITAQQESLLRLRTLSGRDAWNLGSFIAEQMHDRDIALAVAISRPNGAILFQHLPDGTTLTNQKWMRRKFNTVAQMERSSLGVWAITQLSGETVSVHGLSEKDYVFVGGGFPLRLASGEMVGVLTVSNLAHWQDHHQIVDWLAQWTHLDDVPQLPVELTARMAQE